MSPYQTFILVPVNLLHGRAVVAGTTTSEPAPTNELSALTASVCVRLHTVILAAWLRLRSEPEPRPRLLLRGVFCLYLRVTA
eukprot:4423533-Amphidinium_carterae.1